MAIFRDTIAAISTPIGRGAIGIARLSGPDALKIAEKLFNSSKRKKISDQKGNTILHGKINIHGNKIHDKALIAIFKSPNSYTGEDMVEFNCHSNPLMLNLLLDSVIKNGARLAEPGEFSKRAFMNDKLDLMQAEAILNLINAKTEKGLAIASKVILGEDSRNITETVEVLENILVNLEAEIDFPGENSINFDMTKSRTELENITLKLKKLSEKRNHDLLYTNGIKCTIIGKPNVGKSTLLNALLDDERAITSEFPGTTRDIIREQLNIDGIPVSISDTAGISEKPGKIESVGIDKAISESELSDILILLIDGSEKFTKEDEKTFSLTGQIDYLTAVNKCDLPEKIEIEKIEKLSGSRRIIKISAKFKTNLYKLKKELSSIIKTIELDNNGDRFSTSFAFQNIFKESIINLEHAIEGIRDDLSIEFIAEDIKAVLKSLGSIVKSKTPEDILIDIFSRFCIGK